MLNTFKNRILQNMFSCCFQATFKGWMDIMYSAVDSRDVTLISAFDRDLTQSWHNLTSLLSSCNTCVTLKNCFCSLSRLKCSQTMSQTSTCTFTLSSSSFLALSSPSICSSVSLLTISTNKRQR